eukprot:g2348.t1
MMVAGRIFLLLSVLDMSFAYYDWTTRDEKISACTDGGFETMKPYRVQSVFASKHANELGYGDAPTASDANIFSDEDRQTDAHVGCSSVANRFKPGEVLKQPWQIRVSDYADDEHGFKLHMIKWGSWYECSLNARGYSFVVPANDVPNDDGSAAKEIQVFGFPGPTLIFPRGATAKVTLVNDLKDYVSSSTGESIGEWADDRLNKLHRPNYTNLHTHGMHVPHEAPGDDVKIVVGPGEKYTYEYEVSHDHHPGTHWYHPHVHGSTALQVGGGAFGLIIVEDDETRDGLPNWLWKLEGEMQLVISVLPLAEDSFSPSKPLYELEEESWPEEAWNAKDSKTNNPVPRADYLDSNSCSENTDLVMVNGQLQPKVQMSRGWYRWRLLLASVGSQMRFVIERADDGEATEESSDGTDVPCELGILAKDGIYLRDFPRSMDYVKMVSGSRVDVVVRCKEEGNYRLITRNDSSSNSCGGGYGCIEPGVEILSLEVSDEFCANGCANQLDTDLLEKSVTPVYPNYLQDLRIATVHQKRDIQLGWSDGCDINGKRWTDDEHGDEEGHIFEDEEGSPIYPGTVVEFDIDSMYHPLHLHVNPLQVMVVTEESEADWWREGDWVDVIHAVGTFRWHAADHASPIVAHCHWLLHEDEGCMSSFTVEECPDGSSDCATADNGMNLWEIADDVVVEEDACDDGTHNCNNNATCQRTVDGFTCSCNEGYHGNGKSCYEDVNECALGTFDCGDSNFAYCFNPASKAYWSRKSSNYSSWSDRDEIKKAGWAGRFCKCTKKANDNDKYVGRYSEGQCMKKKCWLSSDRTEAGVTDQAKWATKIMSPNYNCKCTVNFDFDWNSRSCVSNRRALRGTEDEIGKYEDEY